MDFSWAALLYSTINIQHKDGQLEAYSVKIGIISNKDNKPKKCKIYGLKAIYLTLVLFCNPVALPLVNFECIQYL